MPDKIPDITGTLVTIGDEILQGDIANGNAHHIARELRTRGFRLKRIVTVGDGEDAIVEVLGRSLVDSAFLIVTGGLGPTDDDRTNAAVSKAFNKPLAVNREYADWLRVRLAQFGSTWSGEVERMARIPEGAVKIGLDMAGFFLLHDAVPCYFLPGVPGEMKDLLGRVVIPGLEKIFPKRPFYLKHVLRVQGLIEAEINRRLKDPGLEATGVDIGYLPQGRENWVTIFASAPDERQCRLLVESAAEKITRLIGARFISGRNEESLEKVVGDNLRQRGWRLAAAESCTGGLLTRKITSVAGASDYLDRAFVTYSNRAKTELLGVPQTLLEDHGAVSGQVAAAMAVGARDRAGVEVGVAITGIAGPSGGTEEKPVGTVFVAGITATGQAVERLRLSGTRDQIQEGAAQGALALLWRLLTDDTQLHSD